jgi:hypothetical protein
MRTYAVSKHAALMHHPWATGLLGSCDSSGPANMRLLDAVLACLLDAGLTATEALHVYSALNSYVYGFGMLQGNAPFKDASEHKEVMEVAVRSLPANQYPHSTEVGLELMRTGYEYSDEFAWGLDVLLDGLETALPKQRPQE